MARIWSDEGKLAAWFEVELAALDAWAEVGAVPVEVAETVRAQAQVPTPARVAEIEQLTDHDTAAFVDAIAEQLGLEGQYVHYGLTSSDVVDTALALLMRESANLVLAGLRRGLTSWLGRRSIGRRLCDRTLARHPRGADHLRLQAGRLGVPSSSATSSG